MSRGINKVIIVGNLGNDPDSRAFPDGGVVSNISVATSEAWRDRNTGEMQERTEWHRIVLRDRGNYRLGQIAQQYLRKGSKVYVEGSLRTRKYTDAQGQERYITEIIADQLQMLDSRQAGQADAYSGSYDAQYGAPTQPQYQAPPVQTYQQQPSPPAQSYQQAAPQAQTTYSAPPPVPAAPAPVPTAPMTAPEPSQPPFPSSGEFDDDIPF